MPLKYYNTHKRFRYQMQNKKYTIAVTLTKQESKYLFFFSPPLQKELQSYLTKSQRSKMEMKAQFDLCSEIKFGMIFSRFFL